MSLRRATKGIAVLLAALVVVVLVGPQLSYRRATSEDTPQAYRQFLSKHSRGWLASQARRKLADALWRSASTPYDYEAFAEEFPRDPRAKDALKEASRAAQYITQALLDRYQSLKMDRRRALAEAQAQNVESRKTVRNTMSMIEGATGHRDTGLSQELLDLTVEELEIAARGVNLTDQFPGARSLSLNTGLNQTKVIDEKLRAEAAALHALLTSRSPAIRRAALDAVAKIMDPPRGSWQELWEPGLLRDAGIGKTVQRMAEEDPDEDVRAAASRLPLIF